MLSCTTQRCNVVGRESVCWYNFNYVFSRVPLMEDEPEHASAQLTGAFPTPISSLGSVSCWLLRAKYSFLSYTSRR